MSDLRNDDFLWFRFFVKRKEGESFSFFLMKKKRMNSFFATFLEKVAQKAAFRETLIPPGFMPPGWLARSAQGQSPID